MLLNDDELKSKQAVFYKNNRGGDITYHGPGQVVGYPILNLDYFFTDIHRYMRGLEEVIIRTLANYDINGGRIKGLTGVWLDKTSTSWPPRTAEALPFAFSAKVLKKPSFDERSRRPRNSAVSA